MFQQNGEVINKCLLKMNNSKIVAPRSLWVAAGWWPPLD